ncbi:hypothetical protein AURDEDRAFT_180472 [Auricularia subglabra TFB-10046 SS5]|nr:hypothetical protein AURDEDRAFT_180472 [Auricularia subglabra TFB-10046 SS5]
MGQDWRLYNIDGRYSEDLCKLGAGIWSVYLHKYLAPDASGHMISLDELRDKLAATHPLPRFHEQKQSPLLVDLPVDVVRHIFDCFGDPTDMLANIDAALFALTCQFCYQIGYGVLKRRQAAFPSWAGQRLIITGDYCRSDYLPPGFDCLPDEEIDSYEDAYPPLKDAVSEHIVTRRLRAARYNILESQEAEMVERHQWKAMFSQTGPQMRNPTLRNLSKREYARGEVLEAAQQGKDRDRGFGALRIGDLAVFRICWSSDRYTNMSSVSILPGKWAGDRFDIVDFAPTKLPEWKDVSESLVQEVAQIYTEDWHGDY